jgi:hypothetical protein
METEGGPQSRTLRGNTITPPTLRRVAPLFPERQCNVLRLGDIWIPKSTPLANHFPRLYIPGVEDLFQVGDRIIRVEHGGTRSRMISWRIWQGVGAQWQFQQESTDEQNFSLIPSTFIPLIPVAEGV